MRQPIGLQRHDDVGDNAAQSDKGPNDEELAGVGPQLGRRFVLGVRQQVDDLAKQHRLVELEPGDRDVGEGQPDGKPPLIVQQTDNPTVDLEKSHLRPVERSQTCVGSPRKRSTVFTKKRAVLQGRKSEYDAWRVERLGYASP
jgi:hypothetical protein